MNAYVIMDRLDDSRNIVQHLTEFNTQQIMEAEIKKIVVNPKQAEITAEQIKRMQRLLSRIRTVYGALEVAQDIIYDEEPDSQNQDSWASMAPMVEIVDEISNSMQSMSEIVEKIEIMEEVLSNSMQNEVVEKNRNRVRSINQGLIYYNEQILITMFFSGNQTNQLTCLRYKP